MPSLHPPMLCLETNESSFIMGLTHKRLCSVMIVLFISVQMIGQHMDFNLSNRLDQLSIHFDAIHKSTFDNYAYVHITLDTLPNNEIIQQMALSGIELLAYKNDNKYLAKISTRIHPNIFRTYGIHTIEKVESTSKISSALKDQLSNPSKNSKHSTIEIAVILNTPFEKEDWVIFNATYQTIITQRLNKKASIVHMTIKQHYIEQLAQHPNVRWIEKISPDVQRLNYENTQIQRTNVLTSTAIGGRALTGKNIVIGVGDGGELGNHIDLNCRIINQADGTYNSYGAHGDHVAGSIAGAGHLFPESKGMAHEAELIIQKTTDIIYETEEYIEAFDMCITNNSYGVGADCATNGAYNYSSINLDRQLTEHPHLLHLFAAGNSGNDSCSDYPQGYKTVLRYYGSAKNVLTVGAIDGDRNIANMSSRGPALDGRIKPEICAPGVNVQSMGRDYNYFEISGTSMATPAVAGNIALLYERYKQLHNNAYPSGALMKAISCNTADDLGAPNPDYIYGFGAFNALRAIEVIEQERYISDTIEHAEFNKYSIDVPVGLSQVKFMLYWHDLAGEMDTPQTLINDLDLRITDSNGAVFRPWTLNPNPNDVTKPAVRAIDHLNNIEQVTIDFPVAGTYEIQVRGFQIPLGTQNYHVTYDFVEPTIQLTYPFGKEQWQPNETEYIQWDAASNNTSLFGIDYSLDGGLNWIKIGHNIPANQRQFLWEIPDVWTENGKVRIRKIDEETYVFNEENFQILPIPQNLTVHSPCMDHVQLSWDKTPMSDTYEISVLNCDIMESIAVTEDTCISIVYNMNLDEEYWFSVRSVTANNKESQRTNAVPCTPSLLPNCEETEGYHHEIDIDTTNTNNPTTAIEETTNFSGEASNIWTVSPNPFEHAFTLNSIQTLSPNSNIRLHSVAGLECTERATITQKGAKTYSVEIDPLLPSGVYYLSIIETNKSYTIPLIKL